MRFVLVVFAAAVALSGPAVLPLQAQAGTRRSAPKPLTSIELLLKLYHGSPAAASTAVKVRGTAFDITPALEKLLVEAGADKSLLALAAFRRIDFVPAARSAVAAASSAGPIRVDAAVQARKLIQRPEAAVPAGAAAGSATVEIIVGTDGRVKTARALGESALAAAAVEAARGHIYRPTQLDGETVEVATEVTIDFSGASR